MARLWAVEAAGLKLGATSVTFQRYPKPLDGMPVGVPRSLGALPVALSDERCLLPLADREAFWIGVLHDGDAISRISFAAIDAAGRARPVREQRYAGRSVLRGIERSDGAVAPLCPPDCVGLDVRPDRSAAARPLRMSIVSPQAYSALTGLPAPAALDVDAGVRGMEAAVAGVPSIHLVLDNGSVELTRISLEQFGVELKRPNAPSS